MESCVTEILMRSFNDRTNEITRGICQLSDEFKKSVEEIQRNALKQWEIERSRLEDLRRESEEARQRCLKESEELRKKFEEERLYFEDERKKWNEERDRLNNKIRILENKNQLSPDPWHRVNLIPPQIQKDNDPPTIIPSSSEDKIESSQQSDSSGPLVPVTVKRHPQSPQRHRGAVPSRIRTSSTSPTPEERDGKSAIVTVSNEEKPQLLQQPIPTPEATIVTATALVSEQKIKHMIKPSPGTHDGKHPHASSSVERPKRAARTNVVSKVPSLCDPVAMNLKERLGPIKVDETVYVSSSDDEDHPPSGQKNDNYERKSPEIKNEGATLQNAALVICPSQQPTPPDPDKIPSPSPPWLQPSGLRDLESRPPSHGKIINHNIRNKDTFSNASPFGKVILPSRGKQRSPIRNDSSHVNRPQRITTGIPQRPTPSRTPPSQESIKNETQPVAPTWVTSTAPAPPDNLKRTRAMLIEEDKKESDSPEVPSGLKIFRKCEPVPKPQNQLVLFEPLPRHDTEHNPSSNPAYRVARGKERVKQGSVKCLQCQEHEKASGVPLAECKHKFNAPPPPTPAGFWDLTLQQM